MVYLIELNNDLNYFIYHPGDRKPDKNGAYSEKPYE